jgi:FkbM family methyltransferase
MRESLKKIYHLLPFRLNFIFSLLNFIKKQRRLLNKNKIEIRELNGIKYELHLNQFIDSSIYYDGCFEIDTTKAIQKIVKPGMMIFDVGANIGCHLLPMAKIIGTGGRIVAFEPMEWPLKKLKRNIELNNFNNILVENIGLSEFEEDKVINFRSSWTIDETVIPESLKSKDVHFTTIDHYLEAKKMSRLDVIKLDVDGYEFKILKGAKKCLSEQRPIFFMELGDYTLKSTGDNISDLIEYFFSFGYEFYNEKDFSVFSNKEEIIKSIPNLDTTTINVIVGHPSKKHLML